MIYSKLLEQGGVWCESTLFSWVDSPDQENGSVELLGSPERKWGLPGEWKIYPVELQDRARLHFPSTYYHVESELQKILKR